MRCFSLFAVLFAFSIVFAQVDEPENLGFEAPTIDNSIPAGWECIDVSCVADSSAFRSGIFSARLSSSGSGEGYFHQVNFFRYSGETALLSGWFRGDGDAEAGIYLMVLDGKGNVSGYEEVRFSQMPGSQWEYLSVSVPLSIYADSVDFGIMLSGSGTLWADDFELLIDGEPVGESIIRQEFPAALDHEFDSGSGIEFDELSDFQMESLVILGKVWVFLKYHHPLICSGAVNWDFKLFRVLPSVLAATDPPSREAALLRLMPSVEPLPPLEYSELPEGSVRIRSDYSWIDGSKIGHSLAYLLGAVLEGRHQGESYYLRDGYLPIFFEDNYSSMDYPDGGYRLLSLYRFWGFTEYWFPYRYATDTLWSEQLAISLPDFVYARNSTDYVLAANKLAAAVGDSHCGIFGDPDALSSFLGPLHLPVRLSYVEDNWVITGFTHSSSLESPLRTGDVVLSVDGEPLSSVEERLMPFRRGSTPWSVRENMGKVLLRGDSETADILIERGGQQFELTVSRVSGDAIDQSLASMPAYGEEPFSIMDSGFGFIDMASLSPGDVGVIRETFAELPGLVVDLRGYPTANIIYEVSEFLIPEPDVFCIATRSDIDNPGTFYWAESLYAGGGGESSFSGPVALLVDEGSASSAEFHAMAWRLASDCIVFGHPTAGADGNINMFQLPGGIRSGFSGVGLYNPDGSETQRVGILPDSVVLPTIDGLQAGRDEVLEAAVYWLQQR